MLRSLYFDFQIVMFDEEYKKLLTVIGAFICKNILDWDYFGNFNMNISFNNIYSTIVTGNSLPKELCRFEWRSQTQIKSNILRDENFKLTVSARSKHSILIKMCEHGHISMLYLCHKNCVCEVRCEISISEYSVKYGSGSDFMFSTRLLICRWA